MLIHAFIISKFCHFTTVFNRLAHKLLNKLLISIIYCAGLKALNLTVSLD